MSTPDNPTNTSPVLTRSPSRPGFRIEQVAQFCGAYVRAFLLMAGWLAVATAGGGAAYVCIRLVIWSVLRIQTAVGF